MSVDREHEMALIKVAKISLLARGYTTPRIAMIMDTVEAAATLVGIDKNDGAVLDRAARHIIAKGELKKEFDNA
jgi:hypothetical protein